LYGVSKDQQSTYVSKLESVRKQLDTWEKVPIFPTKSDTVSLGTAVLGAVSHGRIATLTEGKTKKPKAQLAIRMQNVATTAVGVRMQYKKDGEWIEKTLFDFDRRVPAGPYPLELNAAECAAMRSTSDSTEMTEEELLKAIKDHEGRKGIPRREEAALEFRLQIMQKFSREGEWAYVGNPVYPLTKEDGDDENKRIACEKVTLELSVDPTGMISQAFVGELESVVQANKSARNSKLRYYLGVILAIAFFGGFLVKSYWEERSFEHDTKRLLAYYKHVVPGSLADGDENNARYLVWKYRGKRHKLWKRLEIKYGEPVREVHEWEDEEEGATSDEPQEIDLDNEETSEKEKQGTPPDSEEETPDL